jgi:hypothetical protein
MNQIRKISIGTGYPDKSMHYQVGNTFELQSIPHEIVSIKEEGPNTFSIYIKSQRTNDVVKWKSVSNHSCVIEYNIFFK